MKEKIKSLLKFILGTTAFLYIYGTAGSLEFDMISVRQALIQCGAVIGAVIIGVVIAVIRHNREVD